MSDLELAKAHINRMKQFLAHFDQRKFNESIPDIDNTDVAEAVLTGERRSSRKRFQPLYFADDDLEVLAIVKSWRNGDKSDEERYNRYWWILAALLRSRDTYYTDAALSIANLDYIALYRIGDYSRAAVMTMRGE